MMTSRRECWATIFSRSSAPPPANMMPRSMMSAQRTSSASPETSERLQKAIAACKEHDFGIALQFTNYR